MKKFLFSFFAIAYFANPLLATAVGREEPYGGRCLYINEAEEEQSLNRCEVNIQSRNIEINFQQERYQDGNKIIPAESVSEIASGAYATRLLSDSGSLISSILLGPISVVGRIIRPNRDFQQYIIEYEITGEDKTVTILNINRSDAPEFQQELTIATGKFITFHEGQTRTTVDIGPNFEDVK